MNGATDASAATAPPPVSRSSILEAAARLFGEQGYRKTRLEDVAAQFGVTRAALYYHFKNKQEILFDIHVRAISGLLAGAEAAVAAVDPVDQQLRKMLAHHVAYVARNATYIGIFHEEEAELAPEQRAELNVMRKRYADKLIALYGEGVKTGCFRPVDPRLAIFALLGACNWVYRWYHHQGALRPEPIGVLFEDLLAHGYLLGPPSPTPGSERRP